MDDFKNLFASKTFWGGVIAVLAGILGVFGYTLAADDQAALIDGGAAVAAAIGGGIAIWGRIRATKKIK